MELSNYAEQILNIYNYYNGAIMINRQGIIQYYYNNRKDINTLTEEEVMGRSLFEVYPEITAERSTMIEVIRTGRAMINTYQSLINYKGESYGARCSTFPIFEGERIIGSIEIFLYLEEKDKYLNVFLSGQQAGAQRKGYVLDDIVSVSPLMEKLKKKIEKAAATNSTVMICGETGTGKELVAQALHAAGPRRDKCFLPQNCAAIPENLLESILFGSVKGGFTDSRNQTGLFEAANGGTLFLDEINSMDVGVQAKLLRAIEEKKITRVGGVQEIPVDVRILTALNEDPWECVVRRKLREDLYYRLNVVRLDIPALKERREDIPLLISHYIEFFNRTMSKPIRGVQPEVAAAFCRYSWPGNVRELRNMIESGFNLCEGEYIGFDDIDLRFSAGRERPMQKGRLKAKLDDFETHIIEEALDVSSNLSEAAVQLGISRQTLSSKMKRLDIAERNGRRRRDGKT